MVISKCLAVIEKYGEDVAISHLGVDLCGFFVILKVGRTSMK